MPSSSDELKPGDVYEDCAGHPCLCLQVREIDDPDGISGISLVDGSYPRSCSLTHCGVRRLSLEEAFLWKTKGPQGLPEPWQPVPDAQWWWPKPPEGTNPGEYLSFLYASSLRFLRNTASQLGSPIVGWYSPQSLLDAEASTARVEYTVKGSLRTARVVVEAIKEGRLWPIQRIQVHAEGEASPVVYEGERVRGCGRAG
jgi:hypothetical protein